MMMFTCLNSNNVMRMLLRENLTIKYWLNRSMMMVLVDLTINSSGGLFVTVFSNVFIYHRWSDRFMNSGIMMTSFMPNDSKPLA